MKRLVVILIALAVLHVALINWVVMNAPEKPERSPGAGEILRKLEGVTK